MPRRSMDIIAVIAAVVAAMSVAVQRTDAACCYSMTPKRVDASTYDFDMTTASSKGAALGYRYQLFLQFPAEYITTLTAPTSDQTFSCAPQAGNAYTCTTTNTDVFHLVWRVVSPGAFVGTPHLDKFSLYNESCVLSPAPCTVVSAASAGNGNGTTAAGGDNQNTDGTVDLGALGRVPNNTFYPILAGALITVAGVAYLAYRRSPHATRGQNVEDVERAMTAGGNGSGWFGEKKENNKVYNATVPVKRHDAERVDASGYAPFSPANPNRAPVANMPRGAKQAKSSSSQPSSSTSAAARLSLPKSGGLGSGVSDYNRASMMPVGSLLAAEEAAKSSPPRRQRSNKNRLSRQSVASSSSNAKDEESDTEDNDITAMAPVRRSRTQRKPAGRTVPRRDLKTADKNGDSSDESSSSSSDDDEELRKRVVRTKRAEPVRRSQSRNTPPPDAMAPKQQRPKAGTRSGKSSRRPAAPKKPLVEF